MIDCSGYKHTQMLLAPHCGALFLRQQVKNIYIFFLWQKYYLDFIYFFLELLIFFL